MDRERLAQIIGKTPLDVFGTGGSLRGYLEAYIEPDYPSSDEEANTVRLVDEIMLRIADRVIESMRT